MPRIATRVRSTSPAPARVDPLPSATRYTTPCHRCGTRVRLLDGDELVDSLGGRILCWPCDNSA